MRPSGDEVEVEATNGTFIFNGEQAGSVAALMPAIYETAFKSPFYLSEDASLRRLSRICAGVQAAKPKTNAGFSFASMQKDDSGDGLTPISMVTRLIIGKSSSRFSQATKFNPAS